MIRNRIATVALAIVALLTALSAQAGITVDQGQGASNVKPWAFTLATPTGTQGGTTTAAFTAAWPGQSMVSPAIAASGITRASGSLAFSSNFTATGTFKLQGSDDPSNPTSWVDIAGATVSVTAVLGTPGWLIPTTTVGFKWIRAVWLSTITPQQRITAVADVGGSLAGKFILVSGAQSATFPFGNQGPNPRLFALWFRVSGSGTSPGPVGTADGNFQPIPLSIATNDTATTIAAAISSMLLNNTAMPAVTSANGGTTWTQRATPSIIAVNVYGAFGAGTFAFVGQNRALASPNGTDWTLGPTPPNVAINNVIFAGGTINKFVAVGGTGTTDNVWTSPDGLTWTAQTSSAAFTLNGVCFDGTTIVAIGSGAAAVTKSTNGTVWSAAGTPPPSATYTACAHNGTNFTAVVNGGTTSTSSPDGNVWTSRTQINGAWTNVTAKPGGGFVSVQSASATAQWSSDGITWASITLPFTTAATPPAGVITWDAFTSRFIYGGAASGAFSSDGIAWSSTPMPGSVTYNLTSNGTGTVAGMTSGLSGAQFSPNNSIAGTVIFTPVAGSGAVAANGGNSGFTVEQIFPAATQTFTASVTLSP